MVYAEGACPACRADAPIVGATSLPAVSSSTYALPQLWDGYVNAMASVEGAMTGSGSNPYIQVQLDQAYSDVEVRSTHATTSHCELRASPHRIPCGCSVMRALHVASALALPLTFVYDCI